MFPKGQFTILAILSVVCGSLLMLDNVGILTGVWKLWPVFPFVLGLGGVLFFKRGERKVLAPLGIGAYLVLVSIFFFVLNYTSWGCLGTLWPVFVGILGVSVLVVACFAEHKRWYAVSGLFFVFLAIVFFMVFTVGAKLWPVSLILFGTWLLLIPERSSREKRSCDN